MSKIDDLITQYCPNGVEFRKLGQIVCILNGYAFKSSKYSDSGIRVIRISDVQKSKMSDKDIKYYPIETQQEIKRYLLQENDLVMSLTGNVGRVAMLSNHNLPAGLNQRVACIRANDITVLTRYLFYFFDQDIFESKAMNNATGGGQKNMNYKWLSSYLIPIPPIPVQEEIVKILDTFTELEARKKQYNYYRDELLSFGEGEYKPLGEVAEYSKTRIAHDQLDNTNYVGVDNLLQNRAGKVSSNYAPKSGNLTRYCEGDTLIGNIRPYLKKIWHADRLGGANGDVLVIHPMDKRVSHRYLYQVLADEKFFNYSMKYAKGAKMPRGSKSKILDYPIPIPYPDNPKKSLAEQARIVSILDKFDALVNDISIGLPAEITARRQQYEYYRNKLLRFKEV